MLRYALLLSTTVAPVTEHALADALIITMRPRTRFKGPDYRDFFVPRLESSYAQHASHRRRMTCYTSNVYAHTTILFSVARSAGPPVQYRPHRFFSVLTAYGTQHHRVSLC